MLYTVECTVIFGGAYYTAKTSSKKFATWCNEHHYLGFRKVGNVYQCYLISLDLIELVKDADDYCNECSKCKEASYGGSN